MIERPRLAREWKPIFSSAILYFEESFGYLNVRGSVLSHCTELDEVCLRAGLLHRPYQIESSDDVILLRERGMLPVDHAIGSRRLLAQMYDRVRLRFSQDGQRILILPEVTVEELDAKTKQVSRNFESPAHIWYWNSAP